MTLGFYCCHDILQTRHSCMDVFQWCFLCNISIFCVKIFFFLFFYQHLLRAVKSQISMFTLICPSTIKFLMSYGCTSYLLLLLSEVLLTIRFSSPDSALFFGIQSTAFKWFESYLLDRRLFISVNNSSSPPSQLKYGLPQGSVLGPALFVLYATPLCDIIAGHSVNHQLFADDTQLWISTPLSEIDNLTKELCACT